MNVEKNKKLFTKEKKNNIISDKYNPLNYEREGLFMKVTKDVVLDVVKDERVFIEEKLYQKIKTKLNKNNDYFSEKEIKKIYQKLIWFFNKVIL